MHRALQLHPDFRSAYHVEVDVSRPHPGQLALRYTVTGKMSELHLPPVVAPTRTDELWRHTCFEAFVRPAAGQAYCEFNFAPSTQWAAYRFSGTRSGMTSASEIAAPRFEVKSQSASLELLVSLDLNSVSILPGDATWHLNLTAVIEENSGAKSYWALAHPPGKPDFHHPDCFVLELPAE